MACYVLICVGLIVSELYLIVISPKHVWILRSYVFIRLLQSRSGFAYDLLENRFSNIESFQKLKVLAPLCLSL